MGMFLQKLSLALVFFHKEKLFSMDLEALGLFFKVVGNVDYGQNTYFKFWWNLFFIMFLAFYLCV